jgi:hypothetical protein
MIVMSENKREELLEIHGQLDDLLANMMHDLEEDETVTEKTWRNCESNYNRVSRVLKELYESIYFT